MKSTTQIVAAAFVLLLPATLSFGADTGSKAPAKMWRELLWPSGAPGAKGSKPLDQPALTYFLPNAAKNSGTAVIICPGGGYGFVSRLVKGWESDNIATWLSSLGVAGIILEYRTYAGGYRHPAPLQDAQRAIRTVRFRAAELGIDPSRIGIMGFSAGGHLASTAGTHFDKGNQQAADRIERVSSRPDFLVLCYPVIALGEPFASQGSQENLLDKDASPELIRSLSSEKQVTHETPPTFLYHTTEDTAVPPENSLVFYQALLKAKVPAELHIYRAGGHGTGTATTDVPGTRVYWMKDCEHWMEGLGLLEPQSVTAPETNNPTKELGSY